MLFWRELNIGANQYFNSLLGNSANYLYILMYLFPKLQETKH